MGGLGGQDGEVNYSRQGFIHRYVPLTSICIIYYIVYNSMYMMQVRMYKSCSTSVVV